MLNRLSLKGKAIRVARASGALSAYAFAMLTMNPSAALAQSAEQTADQASDDGLQQIVVTANRREESANDVSTAISAFGADQLRNANVNDIKDLAILAPSLTVTEVFDIAQIYIRGVGTNVQNPGASGGVAIYTDGAPIERQEAQLTSMFDLERVEVLSGPQGTLYGRNAIGGAVNYITSKPTDTLQGYVRFGAGNYDSTQLTAAIGGPITDWLKVRVAFNMQNRGGFGKNITSGNPINNEHRQMGRLTLVIEPSSKFKATVSAEYYHQDDAAGILTLDGGASIDPATGKQTTQAGIINPATGQFAVTPLGLGGYALNPRDTSEPLDPFTRKDRWSATAQFDWDIADWLRITSINNIQQMVSWTSENNAKSSIFLYTSSTPLTRRIGEEPQASSELQFKVNTHWVNGIVGLTYFRERQTENQTLGSDGVFANYKSTANRDYLIAKGYDVTQVLSFCRYIGAMILQQPNASPPRICAWGLQNVEAFGVFGHANVDLGAFGDSLSQFTLKLGARYSDQSNDVYNPNFFFGYNASFNANPVVANVTSFSWLLPEKAHNHGTWSDFSPEIGLEWRPAEDMLLYYTYSEGFKAGTGLIVSGNTNLAGPEKIRNHEIGFKGSFADHRLQVNLSAFTYNLTGAQYSRSFPNPDPTGPSFLNVFENAANTKASGGQIEIQSIPYRSEHVKVQLNTSLIYQHSRFVDYKTVDPADPRLFPAPPADRTPLLQNLSGNPTRNAPDWAGSAQLGIEFRSLGLPGDGTLTLSGDVSYQSRSYLTEFKKLVESTGPRAIVGSQLLYRNHAGISASLWVKNLTDREFKTGITYINAAGATREVSLFPPRTFGATIGYEF